VKMNMTKKILWNLSAFCLVAVSLEPFAAEPPLIVAHRRLLHHAPENTFANYPFELAAVLKHQSQNQGSQQSVEKYGTKFEKL